MISYVIVYNFMIMEGKYRFGRQVFSILFVIFFIFNVIVVKIINYL